MRCCAAKSWRRPVWGWGACDSARNLRRQERVLRSGSVVCNIPDGVDFDGEKAHLIVGIAGVGDEHLEILARLSASFEDEELLQRLMTATDPQVIYDALK